MKFRMVDQILAWEAKRFIRGTKVVSFEEYCLRQSQGTGEHLPESLLLESLLQLGNWLVILSSQFTQLGMVCAIERVEFCSALGPGEQMSVEVSVGDWGQSGMTFHGQGLAGNREVVRVQEWRVECGPLAEYIAPEDLRVLYSEIHRPRRGEAP